MHPGSNTDRLAKLALGEAVWIETSLDRYSHDMRTACVPRTRRPPELGGKEFTAGLFTAVSTSKAGDIVYLIRLTRTA